MPQSRPYHGAELWKPPLGKSAQQEPVAWKHDCAALLTNDVELWIDRCPHCGKPRTSPPQRKPLNEVKLKAHWKRIIRSEDYDCPTFHAFSFGFRTAEATHGIKENT